LGEPAWHGPATFHGLHEGAVLGGGIQRRPLAVDVPEHCMDHSVEPASFVHAPAEAGGLRESDVGGALELAKLVGSHAQQLAQLAADLVRSGRAGIDQMVETRAVAEDSVDQRGRQAAVARVEVGVFLEVL